jgi:hypothetical protein
LPGNGKLELKNQRLTGVRVVRWNSKCSNGPRITNPMPTSNIPRANLRWHALPLKITADGLARP